MGSSLSLRGAATLYQYTDGIKYCTFLSTLTRVAQQWFTHLESGIIHSFADLISMFLRQFASARRYQKIALSLFILKQVERKELRKYIRRFTEASLEVPSVSQDVRLSTFIQGLWEGDFFKSLAKKPATDFDALMVRAPQYMNMKEAQTTKGKNSEEQEGASSDRKRSALQRDK